MFNKKYYFYIFLIFSLSFFIVDNTFAFQSPSEIASGFLNQMYNMAGGIILTGLKLVFQIGLSFMIGFATFFTLILTGLIDLFFRNVPSLGMFLGDITSYKTFLFIVFKLQSFIFLFATFIWVLISSIQYLQVVKDKTIYGESKNKFNIFENLFQKIVIVVLMANIPLVVIPVKTFVSGASDISISFLISMSENKQDVGFVKEYPVTTLLTTGMGIPIGDINYNEGMAEYKKKLGSGIGKENNLDNAEYYNTTSILENNETSNSSSGTIVVDKRFNKIIQFAFDKGFFNYFRFYNMYDFIATDQQVDAVTSGDGNTSFFDSGKKGITYYNKGILLYLFVLIFYIVLLFAVGKQIIDLIMKLVTRFVKVLLGDFFLIFHIFSLSTETSKHVGRKNILSYIGDILVTPIIAVITGFSIVFLLTIANYYKLGYVGNIFLTGVSTTESNFGIILVYFILILILYGIFNMLNNLIESIGANFEYYVTSESNNFGGMKDGYSSSGNALQSAQQGFDLSKSAGSLLGVASGYNFVKNIANREKDLGRNISSGQNQSGPVNTKTLDIKE